MIGPNTGLTFRIDFGHSYPVESSEGIVSRLNRMEVRPERKLFKNRIVLTSLLVVSGSILLVASGLLIFSDEPSLRDWAMTALPSVLAGYFGWFAGKYRK